MKSTKIIIGLALSTLVFSSCNKGNNKADGYGNFEATETTVSAESNGKLLAFSVEEGYELGKNAVIGYVDTTQLSLKKEQLQATKNVVRGKSKGVLSQISVLQAQLKSAMTSKRRVQNLLKEGASTQQKLDNVNGRINVIHQQVRSIKVQNATVLNELKSIASQLKQIEDQIEKSKLVNPVKGTVLVKYAEPFEITNFGKPLYKIADLSTMKLRVYISEKQLSSIKIGQRVTVKVDGVKEMKSYNGKISWIASEAEFTPKIIQTKEERVNLVYAVKIEVKNDGYLKIGMPAEMWVSETTKEK